VPFGFFSIVMVRLCLFFAARANLAYPMFLLGPLLARNGVGK
jgi:hypothetical protein